MYAELAAEQSEGFWPRPSACRVQISLNLIAVNSTLRFTLLGQNQSPSGQADFYFLCSLEWEVRCPGKEAVPGMLLKVVFPRTGPALCSGQAVERIEGR